MLIERRKENVFKYYSIPLYPVLQIRSIKAPLQNTSVLSGVNQTDTAYKVWEHSGLVVECLTRDKGAAGSSLTDDTALCP